MIDDTPPPIAEPDTPQHTSLLGGRRKAALGFIFATALMDVLAIGIIIPVLPHLIESFVGGDTATAAHWVGIFGTVWAAMQFIFSPVTGALSDRFGRRPVLLISSFGLAADYVVMAVAPGVAWLLVGRIMSGVTASSFSTAGAYIADVTPPEKRAQSFGLIGAAFGVGFVLGPALGGVLGHIDLRLPFWAAAGLAAANWLYGFFILPESLPRERRARLDWKKANPLGAFQLLRSHPELLSLAAVLFLFYLSHQVLQSVFVLYTSYRYGWTPLDMGLNLMAVGVAAIVVQALLVKPVVGRFGERGALMIGLMAGMTGFFLYGYAPTSLFFWGVLPVFALMNLVGPGVNGMMSKRVGPSEQGRLQGANSSNMAVAGLIGPLLFTSVFAASISGHGQWRHPGLAPWLSGVLLGLALLIACRIPRTQPQAATSPA
jgi:DHA1 family tetracycline resistance protein-like MFS transporter